MSGLRARMRPAAAPADPADEMAKLRADVRRLGNEQAALKQQLRDTARERDRYRDERDAGRLMVVAAQKACEASCEHAKAADDWRRVAHGLQDAYDEVRAVNEARDSLGFAARRETSAADVPRVPRQRRRAT